MMKTQHNWHERISDWKASGLTRLAYCKQKGISYPTFSYHIKKNEERTEHSNAFESLDFLESAKSRSEELELFSFKVTSLGKLEIRFNIDFALSIRNDET